VATEKTPANSSPADYSATQAPENAPHVESKAQPKDNTLKPGGAHGAKAAVGMSAMDRDVVPSGAVDPHQTDYGSPAPPGSGGSDRE
jgi:hypothetical protein